MSLVALPRRHVRRSRRWRSRCAPAARRDSRSGSVGSGGASSRHSRSTRRRWSIGGGGLATTAYLRLFLILGSVVGLVLAVAGLAGGTRRDAPGRDARHPRRRRPDHGPARSAIAVLAATTGGAVRRPDHARRRRDGRAGRRSASSRSRAVVVAAPWRSPRRPGSAATSASSTRSRSSSASPTSPSRSRSRCGSGRSRSTCGRPADRCRAGDGAAGPDRLRARVAGGRRPGLGRRVGRAGARSTSARTATIVLAIAVASIVLAAVAAFVQDDLEHVLGYSIVGDAGVIVLALAALGPAAWAPGPDLDPRLRRRPRRVRGLGGGIRAGFFTGPRRRPARLGTPLAAAGGRLRAGRRRQHRFPGLASFDARASLVGLAVTGPLPRRALIVTSRRSPTTGGCWRSGWRRPGSRGRTGRRVAAPRGSGQTSAASDTGGRRTWDAQPRVHDRPSLRCWHSWRSRRRPVLRGPRPPPTVPTVAIPDEFGRRADSPAAGHRLRRRARAGAVREPVRPRAGSVVRGEHPEVDVAPVVEQLGRVEPERELGAAVSGLSDAWTMFWAVSSAKSPRIVPGAASCGRVAPLIARTTAMAFGPSSASATSGPEMMNSTSPAKNGFSRWAA